MAVCKIYTKDTNDIGAEAKLLALTAEAEAAERAGLADQAKRAKAEIELRQDVIGDPLTDDEIRVYKLWYPTAYRVSWMRCGCGRMYTNQADPYLQTNFARYNFDRVPQSVLELIARCRDEIKLDWVEIRTPELVPQDPGLFGGKGKHIWLFARWSDTGEHLITFEEIKAGLDARILKEAFGSIAWLPWAPAALLGAMILTGIGGTKELSTDFWIKVATFATPVLVGWTWFWKRKAKALRKRLVHAF